MLPPLDGQVGFTSGEAWALKILSALIPALLAAIAWLLKLAYSKFKKVAEASEGAKEDRLKLAAALESMNRAQASAKEERLELKAAIADAVSRIEREAKEEQSAIKATIAEAIDRIEGKLFDARGKILTAFGEMSERLGRMETWRNGHEKIHEILERGRK